MAPVNDRAPIGYPPQFLQGVGQVAIEVARLEYLLAELVAVITDQGDDFVDTIAHEWPATRKAYRVAVQAFPDASLQAQLTKLMDDTAVVREERHALVHGVIALDRADGWELEGQWVTYSPREPDAQPQPLPGEDEFAELLRRIGGLTGRLLKLRVATARSVASRPPGETPTVSTADAT